MSIIQWSCERASTYNSDTNVIAYAPRAIPNADLKWVEFSQVWGANLGGVWKLPWYTLWAVDPAVVSTTIVGKRAFDFTQTPPAPIPINPAIEAAFRVANPAAYRVIEQYSSLFLDMRDPFYTDEFKGACAQLVGLQRTAQDLLKSKMNYARAAFDAYTNIFAAKPSILANPELVNPRYRGVTSETRALLSEFDRVWANPSRGASGECSVFDSPTVEAVAALLVELLASADIPALAAEAFTDAERRTISAFKAVQPSATQLTNTFSTKTDFAIALKILKRFGGVVGTGQLVSTFFASSVLESSRAEVLDVLMSGDPKTLNRRGTMMLAKPLKGRLARTETFRILPVCTFLLLCDIVANRGAAPLIKTFVNVIAQRTIPPTPAATDTGASTGTDTGTDTGTGTDTSTGTATGTATGTSTDAPTTTRTFAATGGVSGATVAAITVAALAVGGVGFWYLKSRKNNRKAL